MNKEKLKELNNVIQVCECGKIDASKDDGHRCEITPYNQQAQEYYD